MKTKFLKFKTGFTLIETLVALSIFSVSIVALISVTGSGAGSTNFAKKKFIASYLAQEGIEMVRNIRDTTLLSTGDWNQFILNVYDCTNIATGCIIEPLDLSVTACAPDCPNLGYDNVEGYYGYISGAPSDFTRKITIEDYSPEIKVTSTVSWQQGSTTRSTSYSESMMDWIQSSGAGGGGGSCNFNSICEGGEDAISCVSDCGE